MQDAYNLDAEYSIGLLDVPHKISIAPIIELPFGEGKRWLQSGVGAAILGDWTISSIIGIESGFPMQIRNNSQQHRTCSRACSTRTPARARPRPTARAPSASRRRPARAASPARVRHRHLAERGRVFAAAPTYTLGTLPRTLDDVRTPHRNNWDFSAAKQVRLGGSSRGEIKIEILNLTNTVKITGPTTTRRQRDVRPDPHAVGLHAPDAADVPAVVLRVLGLKA